MEKKNEMRERHQELAEKLHKMRTEEQNLVPKKAPSESKSFGKDLELREDWEEIKVEVMENIVRQKFKKNPELAQKLIETYPQQLVEGNWRRDTFWGMDIKNHQGQNYLGEILMKIREELRQKKM